MLSGKRYVKWEKVCYVAKGMLCGKGMLSGKRYVKWEKVCVEKVC